MKIKSHILFIFCALSLSACNYLDFDETNSLKTEEDMYKYFSNIQMMLSHVYTYVPQSGAFTSAAAIRDCASDDGEFGAAGADIQNVNNGNWSAISTFDDSWDLYYGIRAANSFLKDVAEVDLSRYEHNGSYQNWMKKLKYFPYEARILRAYYFFELARRYGDIAMPLEVLDEDGANSIAKTSFEDVIDFIVSECDEAASDGNLPDTYIGQPDNQVGRITRGFALALKSKALLYAASPLHNAAQDTDKWKKSADAALFLINTGLYQLDGQEAANRISSKEVALHRMNAESNTYELYNFPIRFVEGSRPSSRTSYCNFPTQNLVDAFETINGYTVTLTDLGWKSEDPDFDSSSPYANRDPRFGRVILANGDAFKNGTIESFQGGLDNATVAQGGTPTGYFLRKYIQESTSFAVDANVSNKHHWVVYRYAETLLTYAESMINAFGVADYTDSEHAKSALWAINEVRSNAGMPNVTVTDKASFLDVLYNEWRVEFAFEDHRFWDVRRWKIADETQRNVYGVKIIKASDGTLTYHKNKFENRAWKDCMYLYPIPQKELFNNPNLNPQNVGW